MTDPSTATDHPPLSIATVQQLRAAGWSEEKIATAAQRKAQRDGRGGSIAEDELYNNG